MLDKDKKLRYRLSFEKIKRKLPMLKKYASIKQNDEQDCGAACIATVLKQYKSDISIATIREIVGTSLTGTNMYGIVNGLKELNFESKAIKTDMSIFDDKDLPYPAIAHIIKDGRLLHYIVIHKVYKDHLLISDPADGLKKINKEDFNLMWTKHIVYTLPTENYTVIKDKKNSLFEILKVLFIDKKLIVDIALASTVVTIIGLVTSFYFQELIDSIIPSGSMKTLNYLSIGVIIAYVFQSTFNYLKLNMLSVLGNRMVTRLMLSYYNHVLKLPMNFFATRKNGEIVSRFTDANHIVNGLASSVLTVILDVSMVIIISIVMIFQNKNLFFVTLISIPFYVIVIYSFVKKYDKNNHAEMENNAKLNSYIIESFEGIETIKSLQMEKAAQNKVDTLFTDFILSSYKTTKTDNLQGFFKQLIQLITNGIVLWYGATIVINQDLSIGQLVTFNMLMSHFTEPLLNIINIQPQLQSAKVAADRLSEIMVLPPESKNDEQENNKIFLPKGATNIVINNLNFNYPMQKESLTNISMKIRKHEKIALVGKSGTGKSTLAKLLVGYYKPKSGNILIDGYNIEDVNRESLRQKIILTPQSTFFFSGTIYENLTLGLPIKRNYRKEIIKMCKLSCIHDFIEGLPYGYDTYIEENAENLSGGQKQRLAIARALLRRPSLLILDESTSNIDYTTERQIMNNILNIKSLTVIVIAHRLSMIKNMDRIIVLNEGKITESGSHKELIAKKGDYYDLWEVTE